MDLDRSVRSWAHVVMVIVKEAQSSEGKRDPNDVRLGSTGWPSAGFELSIHPIAGIQL